MHTACSTPFCLSTRTMVRGSYTPFAKPANGSQSGTRSLFTGTQLRLIKLQNPWGHPEWNGAWANGSAEWQEHPWAREFCKHDGGQPPTSQTSGAPTRRSDGPTPGVFVMRWEDFAGIFTKLDICEAKGAAAAHSLMSAVKPRKIPGRPRTHVTDSDFEAAVRVLRAAADDAALLGRLQTTLGSCAPPHEVAHEKLCMACAEHPPLAFRVSRCERV